MDQALLRAILAVFLLIISTDQVNSSLADVNFKEGYDKNDIPPVSSREERVQVRTKKNRFKA